MSTAFGERGTGRNIMARGSFGVAWVGVFAPRVEVATSEKEWVCECVGCAKSCW